MIVVALALLGGARIAQATCTSPCVQEGTTTAGASPQSPTLPVAATVGNIVTAQVALTTGTATFTCPNTFGPASTTIADTGSSSGGDRLGLCCWKVSTASVSTISISSSSGNLRASLQEFLDPGNGCTTDVAASTTAATTGTGSTANPSITTLTANDLVIAAVTHSHGEVVTDNQSSPWVKLNTNSTNPTLNPDYNPWTATGTFAPTWSWTTSANNAAYVTDLKGAATATPTPTPTGTPTPTPTPTGTPTPTATPTIQVQARSPRLALGYGDLAIGSQGGGPVPPLAVQAYATGGSNATPTPSGLALGTITDNGAVTGTACNILAVPGASCESLTVHGSTNGYTVDDLQFTVAVATPSSVVAFWPGYPGAAFFGAGTAGPFAKDLNQAANPYTTVQIKAACNPVKNPTCTTPVSLNDPMANSTAVPYNPIITGGVRAATMMDWIWQTYVKGHAWPLCNMGFSEGTGMNLMAVLYYQSGAGAPGPRMDSEVKYDIEDASVPGGDAYNSCTVPSTDSVQIGLIGPEDATYPCPTATNGSRYAVPSVAQRYDTWFFGGNTGTGTCQNNLASNSGNVQIAKDGSVNSGYNAVANFAPLTKFSHFEVPNAGDNVSGLGWGFWNLIPAANIVDVACVNYGGANGGCQESAPFTADCNTTGNDYAGMLANMEANCQ
jgi:hypothetical protein